MSHLAIAGVIRKFLLVFFAGVFFLIYFGFGKSTLSCSTGFTFSWLFVTLKLCKILLDISVCLLFSLSYRQSKATKDDSLLSACPPHRCFTIYFAFTGRTRFDFHCCLATSIWCFVSVANRPRFLPVLLLIACFY